MTSVQRQSRNLLANKVLHRFDALRADVLHRLDGNGTDLSDRHSQRLHWHPTRFAESRHDPVAVQHATKNSVVNVKVANVVEHNLVHSACIEQRLIFAPATHDDFFPAIYGRAAACRVMKKICHNFGLHSNEIYPASHAPRHFGTNTIFRIPETGNIAR